MQVTLLLRTVTTVIFKTTNRDSGLLQLQISTNAYVKPSTDNRIQQVETMFIMLIQLFMVPFGINCIAALRPRMTLSSVFVGLLVNIFDKLVKIILERRFPEHACLYHWARFLIFLPESFSSIVYL